MQVRHLHQHESTVHFEQHCRYSQEQVLDGKSRCDKLWPTARFNAQLDKFEVQIATLA